MIFKIWCPSLGVDKNFFAEMLPTPTLSHIPASLYMQVYEPAEDTFLMLDCLEESLAGSLGLCVEIGSGSGCISAFLAKHYNIHMIAIDINPIACKTTLETAAFNHTNVDSLRGDLLHCIRDGVVDLIVFNPPYVVTSSDEIGGNGIEAAWAGGIDGREVIDRFLQNANVFHRLT